MDMLGVVEVFTAKPIQKIMELGGTQSWVLNPARMESIAYVVCVRNDTSEFNHEFPGQERSEPRNAAFFVGKVKGITLIGERKGRNRYRIEVSEYALPEKPVEGFRAGNTRNPVLYSDVGSCISRGLDIEQLDFMPMPEPLADADFNDEPAPDDKPSARGLTIPEAKEGLSITFGVPVESIQIIISG